MKYDIPLMRKMAEKKAMEAVMREKLRRSIGEGVDCKRPATPLPWEIDEGDPEFTIGVLRDMLLNHADPAVSLQNAVYILRACSAYPRLIAALDDLMADATSEYGGVEDWIQELRDEQRGE